MHVSDGHLSLMLSAGTAYATALSFPADKSFPACLWGMAAPALITKGYLSRGRTACRLFLLVMAA